MSVDEEIIVGPELSHDFQSFEELCTENSGQELTYLEMVGNNPLEMDAVTLAFSLTHFIRLSRELMDTLLMSMNAESEPELKTVLALQGIQLDKKYAPTLREVIFAFRDSEEPETAKNLVKALQLMTIRRERAKVTLNLGESYSAPEDSWTSEDFGGDESLLETVRAIEDPRWIGTEEK
ncbi:MAG TPA: hypothetical protein VMC85_19265 [Desulfomonilaceae bacterium]|nr:hypothetical protein [Desulfomonilaceae bacterium]